MCGEKMVSEWVNIVQSLGFPIFVCAWFMLRMEGIIKANTTATLELSEYVRATKITPLNGLK